MDGTKKNVQISEENGLSPLERDDGCDMNVNDIEKYFLKN